MASGSGCAVPLLPRKESSVLKGHEGAVLAVRFNGDGNYCLSCGKDRTLRLWNPHRGILIKTYKSHGREVRDVHVTSDNAKLCSCGGDRQLFYWDVSTGRVIRKFRGHDSEVNSVKFNEYGSVVVSAGYDQSVRAFDCRSQSTEPIQIIDTFQDSVMSVCLTKTEIIAGSVDGTVRTFDIRIGRELVDEVRQPVNCISLSNDANCVLASCLDSTLRLLDRSTGELLQEYKGHTCKSFKMDCCLTNTDAHVIGGSEDGSIYFWDLVDASVVSSFRAHTSVVTSVSYHPKDTCMITSSVDGTVRVWKT
ncbi:WD repeat domain-containing protein 83 [Iris pallida]|uniref:WD repeat domain-containing protein 83 n=1 Tax=Iris pallida TaxID=29817 RepID=A0AAX6FB36_IRIPA|nr:WD repeat domain-containing protein 83 [Iris pallida]